MNSAPLREDEIVPELKRAHDERRAAARAKCERIEAELAEVIDLPTPNGNGTARNNASATPNGDRFAQTQPELADAIAAEARALAAAADHQEIAQGLTLNDLFPAKVADAIEARTRYLPITGPSAALVYLAGVAGLVKLGTEVVGSAASGLIVPANLYACLVGPSGLMKSPQGKLLVKVPAAPLVKELAAEHQARLTAWKQESEGKGKGDPPQPRRILLNDATGEALAATLQESEAAGLGLLLCREELAGLFGSLNAYRGGRGGDEQHLLELYDGDGMTSARISSSGRTYSRAQFSIYGSTQPEVLQKLVAEGDANGLWARFMFAPVPARAVMLPEDDDPTEAEAAAATLERIARAVYAMPPRQYRLTRDAATRFRAYHYGRQKAALEADLNAHRSLYGKAAGKVLRIAGLLHLLMFATTGKQGREIEEATLIQAITLVDHLDVYALGVHTTAADGSPSDLMRTVHRIAQRAGGGVTTREVTHKLSPTQRSRWDTTAIRAAMDALHAAGFGAVLDGAKGGGVYRASRDLP